jgi:hypothetical protein
MKKIVWGIWDGKDLVMIPDSKGYLQTTIDDLQYLQRLASDSSIVKITLESLQQETTQEQNPSAQV